MSDYTTPAVSDESVNNLASSINSFYTEVSGQVVDINEMLAEVITKHYTVNHEPQIELPFEKEYEYICEKINKSLSSVYKTVNDFTHIFISGYLPNGKTIHPNSLDEDESGHTVSKYSRLYINGVPYDSSDYTCRAEEGGWERLNVLIIGAPKMSPYDARLEINYADIPLKNFKMIVFDDVEEPIYPDINSFLASRQIDTLKCIGDLMWTSSELCTLRRLEITGNITELGTMDCPCLQELIIPNVTNVPNTSSTNKSNIVKLDISNVRGTVGNLSSCSLDADIKLNASEISYEGFKNSRIKELDVGNSCMTINPEAFRDSTCTRVILGKNMSALNNNSFFSCKKLKRVDFKNLLPISLYNNAFQNCYYLTDVNFSYIKSISNYTFSGCTSLAHLTFIDKSISCNLYFNASPVLTEQSCLNIINAIADGTKISVSLHSAVKTSMTNSWYCKEVDGKYISCAADDEGAVTQAAAILTRGGTLA